MDNKVLLIDDDPDFAMMLRTLLCAQNFQVHAVFDGRKAVAACREVNPDVVILDLLMPGMDGWQVCEQIRKQSDMPIMIISAVGAPASVARALDAGADDYLIKPVPAGLIASRLRSLLRRSSPVQVNAA
jgi:DNA-binding response OmpR family regulator